MAAVLASRKRCAGVFLDEPALAPPHLAKRGRFTPAPAAFAEHNNQQEAILKLTKGAASSAPAEAAELRKKVAELEATNYALAARMLGGTDSCRFQAAFRWPDVF